MLCFKKAEQHAISPQQKLTTSCLVAEELQALDCLEDALSLMQKNVKQWPDSIRVKMLAARILQKTLDLNTATQLYQEILCKAPHTINAQLQLAKIFSETHRQPQAIALLKKLYTIGNHHLPLLMALGKLTSADEDWEEAYHWYTLAYKRYSHFPTVYGPLANALYHLGNIEAAMQLLAEVIEQFPDAPSLPLQLASLKLRFGLPDDSYTILESACQRFPSYIPIHLRFLRLCIKFGQFDQVRTLLQRIETDNSGSLKQIALIQGSIALCQLHGKVAAVHFRTAISISPTGPHEYQMLAHALLLSGDIEQAYTQLSIATDTLTHKCPPRLNIIPIKSHVAVLVNQMRLNPPMLEQLRQSLILPIAERLKQLANIISYEPNYLGAYIYLAKDLRVQGIFEKIQHVLPANRAGYPTIPKQVIQFWDDPQPPPAIEHMGHSWQKKNPDYGYIRFSQKMAIRFLKAHYGPKVVQAFRYCEHPATQSDLFRLAYLYKMGGFYADADDRCRASLDALVDTHAQFIVYQEPYASIGNNFIGCVPKHPIIKTALETAVENLLSYTTEGPWLTTGPGIMTIAVCQELLPYLKEEDYHQWPRLIILTREELGNYVWPHNDLPYKHSEKSWIYATYRHQKNRHNSGSLTATSIRNEHQALSSA